MRKLAATLVLIIGIGADGALWSAADAAAATTTTQLSASSSAVSAVSTHHGHHVVPQPDPFVFAH